MTTATDRYKGVTATVREGAPFNPDFADADAWTVTLHFQGRQMTVPFYKGVGHRGAEPTADEVLECLLSDASSVDNAQGFEDWAAELGYDTDSRTAERIYKACERIERNLHRLLGDSYQTFMYGGDDA